MASSKESKDAGGRRKGIAERGRKARDEQGEKREPLVTADELRALLGAPQAIAAAAGHGGSGEETAEGGRRRFRRFAGHIPVQVHVGGEVYRGVTEDIGLGGVRLHTEGKAPDHREARLQLRIPQPPAVVEAPVHLLWHRCGRARSVEVGVCIDALRPEDYLVLSRYFAQWTEGDSDT
ncbi:MAG: PilZ domain-containing protein [Candidatus Schekmanbacteria bacterium]|nr:PilZ domain-containing protein [Candidatus Schekmanbacteria bacterium]